MKDLIQNFQEVVATGANVDKLKGFILQLAFKGELVKQDPKDESVKTLLHKINETKEELVKQKKIRSGKSLPPITQEEKPYEIPTHWEWVRLGEIGDWGAGATPNRSNPEFYNGRISWLKTGELNDGYINKSEETITDEALSKSSLRLNKPGDILIAMYGATIGKLGILEIEATTNQACCACTPFEGIFNQYLFYYLLSQRSQFRSQGTGGAQPNISRTKIIHYLFPLPPYNEQCRVVGKIQELFSLCDNLKEEIKQKNLFSSTFNKSVFSRIQDPQNTSQAENLKFVIKNIDYLCNTKEDIDLLRNSILSLAIQGKLVEQDSKEEPVSVLLEKIKEEKKITKQKSLSSITHDEIPYEIPTGWEWVRLGQISNNIHYGYTASAIQLNTGVKLLRITDIQNNKVNWDTVPYCEIDSNSVGKYELDTNDLLIARTGGTIGKSFLISDVIDKVVFASYLIRAIPNKNVEAAYVKYFLESPSYWKQLTEYSKGTGQPNVNATSLGSLILPLPPKEEQKRIIEKVKQLMFFCDELEESLNVSQREKEKLTESCFQILQPDKVLVSQ